MKTLLRSFATVLFFGLLCSVMVPMAFARFYLAPVDVDSSWLMMAGSPGEKVSVEFVLVNGEEDQQVYELAVLDAEATQEEDGFFALTAETAAQYEIGAWGKLDDVQVTLEAGESLQSTVTLNIPRDVELGEYWGGVSAMQVTPDVEGVGSGLSVAVRNGLRIHLEVVAGDGIVSKMAYWPYIFGGVLLLGLIFVILLRHHHEPK